MNNGLLVGLPFIYFHHPDCGGHWRQPFHAIVPLEQPRRRYCRREHHREAELAQLQHPSTRWQFALGCARVALFPPGKGGLIQTMMKHSTKSIVSTIGAAALIGFILVLPFVLLEFLNQTVTRQNAPGLILLFGFLWLLPTVFIVLLVPLVRTMRAGNSLLATPVSLVFRVVFMILIAWMWGGLLIDQMPCFLGVPNCD